TPAPRELHQRRRLPRARVGVDDQVRRRLVRDDRLLLRRQVERGRCRGEGHDGVPWAYRESPLPCSTPRACLEASFATFARATPSKLEPNAHAATAACSRVSRAERSISAAASAGTLPPLSRPPSRISFPNRSACADAAATMRSTLPVNDRSATAEASTSRSARGRDIHASSVTKSRVRAATYHSTSPNSASSGPRSPAAASSASFPAASPASPASFNAGYCTRAAAG